jgi:hypothetical protein
MYSLNSGEIQEANSKAISLCAKVPPLRPDLEVIPIALAELIHFYGERVKAFEPDSWIKESNSTPLKFGLFNCSHNPRISMVLLPWQIIQVF